LQSPTESEKPKPLLVTAAVIFDGSKFLISQRRRTDKVEPGLWEFPGGKVEFGEDPKTGLKREILEELNLEISVGELLDVASHVYRLPEKQLHVVLLCYLCRVTGGELKNLAVEDAHWITVDLLSAYRFAAADIPLVRALEGYISAAEVHTRKSI
jgi:8-oxo-dGTP diphosphatase